jgi:uncharacterized membrane protein SpoIIM required for sporulation
MNYCPNCGAPLRIGQNFCGNCGFDVREKASLEQAPERATPSQIRGLGRNTVVYLTPEGLQGVEIRSIAVLSLALAVPLPFLVATYYAIQGGALVVYATLWIAASAFLYDELRWRGVRSLNGNPPTPGSKRKSWLVSWHSIRMADWNGKTLWFTSANPRRKLSVTFDQNDAPSVERTLNSWGVRYSWRPPRLPPTLTRFWVLVLLLFITGQVILILAASLPFFPGEKQAYTTILSNTQQHISGVTFFGELREIYLNNIQVAIGGALPFLGTLTYGVASYNTGRLAQAIAVTHQPYPVPTYVILVSLYLLPHTWVEESAYPIATVAGLLAFTKWRSVSPGEFTRVMNRGSSKLVVALGGAAVILAAAGFLEVLVTYLGTGAIVLWAPLVLLYYLWARNRKRRLATESVGSP